MSLMRKASRVLIALLGIIIASFFVWAFLQRQPAATQPPVDPTITPKAEFVLKYPSKTFWGNYVVASVEVPPGTNCTLTYMSPSGRLHEIETIANDSGLCEGRWKIEQSEGKGTGRFNFRIGNHSETHFIEVLSSF